MKPYQPLRVLPVEIQINWMTRLYAAQDEGEGAFKLVAIRPTEAKGYESQRITVLVVDESGFPMPNVRVAFSYSTAPIYALTEEFIWLPPSPLRAFTVPTSGGGQADQIQNDPVKAGEPGGISVYILEPQYPSDVVAGCGMLSDHTGLHLTFQLRRAGFASVWDRLNDLDNRLMALELKEQSPF